MAKEKKQRIKKENVKKTVSKSKNITIAVWTGIVMFVVICFILNIYFAYKTDANANLFTAFSGWLGFLATIGVACFAFYNDKRNHQQAQMQRIFDRIELEIKAIREAQSLFAREMSFAALEDEMTLLNEMWGHKTEIFLMLSQTAIYKRGDIIDLMLRDLFGNRVFYECRQEVSEAVIELNQFILKYAKEWGERDRSAALKNMEIYKALTTKTLMAIAKYSSGATRFFNKTMLLSYKELMKQIDKAKSKCTDIDNESIKKALKENIAFADIMQSFMAKDEL